VRTILSEPDGIPRAQAGNRREGGGPEVARRASPKTGKRRSLREIAAELAQVGHLNERGKPYTAQSIKTMLRPG
jgi:hypothetical protein